MIPATKKESGYGWISNWTWLWPSRIGFPGRAFLGSDHCKDREQRAGPRLEVVALALLGDLIQEVRGRVSYSQPRWHCCFVVDAQRKSQVAENRVDHMDQDSSTGVVLVEGRAPGSMAGEQEGTGHLEPSGTFGTHAVEKVQSQREPEIWVDPLAGKSAQAQRTHAPIP